MWHKDLMKPYKRESGNLILINFSNSRVLKFCMLKLALFQILQMFEGWVYHVVIVQLFIVKKILQKHLILRLSAHSVI